MEKTIKTTPEPSHAEELQAEQQADAQIRETATVVSANVSAHTVEASDPSNGEKGGKAALTEDDELKARNQEALEATVNILQKAGALVVSYTGTSFKALREAGLKFAFSKTNRAINHKRVKLLIGLLGDDKSFAAKGVAVPAAIAIMQGAELYDEDGGALTLETPDIDKYWLVMDGQHRLVACIEADKDMEIILTPCGAAPDSDIRKMNVGSSNWDADDHRKLLAHQKGETDQLMVAQKEAEKIIPGCTSKYYNYALTGKRDAISKRKIEKGELPEYNDEIAQVGFNILRGMTFVADNKKAKTIDALARVFAVKDELSTKLSGEIFGKVFMCAMAFAEETVIDAISNHLSSAADFDAFEKAIKTLVRDFHKANREITDEQLEKAQKAAEAKSLKLRTDAAAKKKGIQDGSVAGVLSQIKQVEAEKVAVNEAYKKAKADKEAADKEFSIQAKLKKELGI